MQEAQLVQQTTSTNEWKSICFFVFVRHYLWSELSYRYHRYQSEYPFRQQQQQQRTGDDDNDNDKHDHDEEDGIRYDVSQLSEETKEGLQSLACLGNSRIDVRLVQILFTGSGSNNNINDETSTSTRNIMTDNGVVSIFVSLDSSRGVYEFANQVAHDVIYGTIPDCALLHYRIGRQLLLHQQQSDSETTSTTTTTIVLDQFLRGEQYVMQRSDGTERMVIAELCLLSGQRHVKESQFETAFEHLALGIRLLGDNGWREAYRLSLGLHNAIAEVAYSTGQFDDLEYHVQETIDHALCFQDALRAHATRVYALGAQDQVQDALALGFDVLRKLGEPVPASTPSKRQMAWAMHKTKRRLTNKTNEAILRLPTMRNEDMLSAMQMYNLIFLYVFVCRQEYASWVAFRMVSLTLDHGLSAPSCVGFVLYATLLCCFSNDIDRGYRYGQLSFALHDRFKTDTWLGRITAVFYGAVHGWKRPYGEAIEPLLRAQKLATNSGDIEFGMLNANMTIWCQLDTLPIPILLDRLRSFSAQMSALGQEMNLTMRQAALDLLMRFGGQGEAVSYEEVESLKNINQGVYIWSHFVGLMHDYVMGDIDAAVWHRKCCAILIDHPFGCGDMGMIPLFDGLVAVALARRGTSRGRNVQVARKRIKLLRKWANKAPDNQLAKLNLLQAELASFNRDESAFSKYKSAIALSKDGGFFLLTALAYERTGRFLLRNGDDPHEASLYLKRAIQRYEAWGAVGKAEHLRCETSKVLCSPKRSNESASSSLSLSLP